MRNAQPRARGRSWVRADAGYRGRAAEARVAPSSSWATIRFSPHNSARAVCGALARMVAAASGLPLAQPLDPAVSLRGESLAPARDSSGAGIVSSARAILPTTDRAFGSVPGIDCTHVPDSLNGHARGCGHSHAHRCFPQRPRSTTPTASRRHRCSPCVLRAVKLCRLPPFGPPRSSSGRSSSF